ncbi:hypothetical protein V3G39_00035 (plasmid) [Dermatophilaceae bacterium Sec6.4]
MSKWTKSAGVTLGATALVLPLISGTAIANADPTPTTTTVNVEIQGAPGPNSVLDIPDNGSATAISYGGTAYPITTKNANNHNIVQASLPPGTYSFVATYNGTRQQVNGVTIGSSAKTVYFQAASVNLALQDHSGFPLTADTASYYANGWHTMTGGQADMLPGAYSFAATYNGTRQQMNGVTVAQPNSNNGANRYQSVGFQTELVNVVASDSAITSGSTSVQADASYFGLDQAYHPITGVNVNNHNQVQAEMLPGTYSFVDSYNGMRQQKNGVVVKQPAPNPTHNKYLNVQSVYFGFSSAGVGTY